MNENLKNALAEIAAIKAEDYQIVATGNFHYSPFYELTFWHARNPESRHTAKALRCMAIYANKARYSDDMKVMPSFSLTFGMAREFARK